jgi:hypothetical protein
VHPRVVDVRKEPYDVYIGHQMPPWRSPTELYLPRSKWRNPFNRAFRDGLMTRQEAIDRYLFHLISRPDLLASLPELEGKVFGCWCAPQPCHGDVLAKLADGLPTICSSGQRS